MELQINSPTGYRYSQRDVTLRELIVDSERYQRPTSKVRIDQLVADWDDFACGVLVINERQDGRLVVMDGQHRLRAAQRKGRSTLPSLVWFRLPLELEARIFRKGNHLRRLSQYDEWRAELIEGVARTRAGQQVIDLTGYYLWRDNQQEQPRIITVPYTVKRILSAGVPSEAPGGWDAGRLERLLRLLDAAWPQDPLATSQWCLEGVAAFLRAYEVFERLALVRRLQATAPETLRAKAEEMKKKKSGGTATVRFAEAMRDAYNWGRRSALLPSLLRRP
jgi:hypothetical protein